MKSVATLVCLLALASAASVLKNGRRFNPEEDNELRTRYISTVDKDGKLRTEDLWIDTRATPKVDKRDVSFNLFTQQNLENPEIIAGDDFEELSYSMFFQKQKKTKFIIHGWQNNKDSPVNTLIKDALLKHHDLNVFVVDWETPANKFYTSAKKAVPYVGTLVGEFIIHLIKYYELDREQVTIVGHSLGAHVAGKAGDVVKTQVGLIHHIVALDPASPLFSFKKIEERVDRSDAEYVQVIHTNGGKLGFDSSLGDADFYPNGGKTQFGCGLDLLGMCSHSRSYEYYAESIPSSAFIAQQCDTMDDFEKGVCHRNAFSIMGQLTPDVQARGDYYLKTNENTPFALGQ